MSIVNLQAHYDGGTSFDCWFKPVRLCHHQWKHLTSPVKQNKNILGETVKRILLAIPLALATLVACFVAIPGFLRCNVTVNTGSNMRETNMQGSHHVVTRKVDLGSATIQAIELRSVGNVIMTYSEEEQYVEMTGDDNLLDYLIPRIEDRKLILGLPGRVSINTRNPISYHLHISHTALNKLFVSGSGSIQVDRLETEELNCKISGQGTISINQGYTNRQTIAISGQGSYNASNFKAKNSHIEISGQGNTRVHTTQSLNVTISGIGSCIYGGAPRQIKPQISGIGHITPV